MIFNQIPASLLVGTPADGVKMWYAFANGCQWLISEDDGQFAASFKRYGMFEKPATFVGEGYADFDAAQRACDAAAIRQLS